MRPLLLAGILILTASCSAERGTSDTPAAGSASTPAANAEAPAVEAIAPEAASAAGLYGMQVSTLEGEAADLSAYAGKVTLVVNVASQCGYTRQYAGLQDLHDELKDQGFAVLAFPSNEFGGQEPGSAEEIRQFCTERFGVAFPMFEKCGVKGGAGQSPVYAFLQELTGEVPGWNFCKYLVGRDGQVVAFYPSKVEPDAAELRAAIEKALG